MKAVGKKVFIILDKVDATPEVPKEGSIATSTQAVVKKATTGVVHSIGETAGEGVKQGDRVYIGENYPDPVNVFGEEVVSISYDNIWAVMSIN